MKTFVVASAMLAAAVLPNTVSAQTTYASRAAFTAAAGTLSTETFASCGTSTVVLTGSLSSSSGQCSALIPGVTYSPATGGSIYIAAPTQSSNLTTALGLNLNPGDPITVAFATNVSAFGVDLFQNNGGGSQSTTAQPFVISFLLGATTIGTYNLTVAPTTGAFFGLTGATFNSVRIAQTSGYAVIDNVSFGSGATAAVPEPATWGLMVLGFGAVGYAMRRRSARVAVAA